MRYKRGLHGFISHCAVRGSILGLILVEASCTSTIRHPTPTTVSSPRTVISRTDTGNNGTIDPVPRQPLLALNAENSTLAVVSNDSQLRIFTRKDKELQFSYSGKYSFQSQITSVIFADELVVVATKNQQLFIIDRTRNQVVRTEELLKPNTYIQSLARVEENLYGALTSDGDVHLFSVVSQQAQHQDHVTSEELINHKAIVSTGINQGFLIDYGGLNTSEHYLFAVDTQHQFITEIDISSLQDGSQKELMRQPIHGHILASSSSQGLVEFLEVQPAALEVLTTLPLMTRIYAPQSDITNNDKILSYNDQFWLVHAPNTGERNLQHYSLAQGIPTLVNTQPLNLHLKEALFFLANKKIYAFDLHSDYNSKLKISPLN